MFSWEFNLDVETIREFIITTVFSGFLGIGITWIAWHFGFYRYPKNDVKKTSLRIWHLLSAFGIFIGAQGILFPIFILTMNWYSTGQIGWVDSLQVSSVIEGWINIIFILIIAVALSAYTSALNIEYKRDVLGERAFKGWKSLLEDIRMGIVGWMVSYPLVIFFGQILMFFVREFFQKVPVEQVAVRELRQYAEVPGLFILMALLIIFVVPILEELLFRGYLQTWFRKRLRRSYAIVLSSAIFTLFHFSSSQGIDNLEILISLFILSLYLGFLYERQQSLWANATLHGFFNGISVLLIMIS